jgi:hypothetical protein
MFILLPVVPTDCSDGRPSDTEELLGRHDYSAANEKDVCEEKQQQQPNSAKNSVPSSEKRQLNFEVSFINKTYVLYVLQLEADRRAVVDENSSDRGGEVRIPYFRAH